jgi:hypothetical protein
MYFDLEFSNGVWIAYDYYYDGHEDDSVICTKATRQECITTAEKMGYRWVGE